MHFAEPIFGLDKLAGGGETSRLFNVSLNGEPILVSFDIVADAFGENNTDIKVFKDVQPAADGRLHLRFTAGQHESPILSALEVIPSKPGLMNPVRIVASDRGFYDPDGDLWQADNFVSGGRIVRRSPIELPNVNGNLFASERYGNFTYMIPVAVNGRYRVRIHFCERCFGCIRCL
ncbi:MAG: malectin domain-containing carbohydrate-binding protein [Bryobacterales bacterium]|nr:malectin domain-containing carbohydrate-binding protein [Bryobacterales bacterium]